MSFGRLLLLLAMSCNGVVLQFTAYSAADAWAAIILTRFPTEMMPLLLTPLLDAGRVQEAQKRSRVGGIFGHEVESYAGYFTVDKMFHSNMFFWFFPAQTEPANAAVLLWLNGGPGRTSMVGAMLENGPFQIIKHMKVQRRNITWTKSFSMIYVDNPVGTGYSFTLNKTALSKSMHAISRNLYSVLIQFLKTFPQFAKNDLYIGGQSYAGKYIPSLGYYIHQRNYDVRSPPELHINFKGIYLGAGFCDPETMIPAFSDFLFNMGFISERDRGRLRKQHINLIRDGLESQRPEPIEYYLHSFFNDAVELTGYKSVDHVLGDEATVSSLIFSLNQWMRSPSVRTALHVGFIKSISETSDAKTINDVMIALQDEFLMNTTRENGFLMDNYKVLHYSGNLDIVVNVPMTEAFLLSVPWTGQAQYQDSSRSKWRVKGRLAGYFTKINNFTRVIVRNSGHMVPSDQPEWALDMMERFVYDRPFSG